MVKESFLYKKVYDGIKKQILQGDIATGEKLPKNDTLCNQYQVSAITVKKAMEILTSEGFLERVPGRGTFVSGKRKDASFPEPASENLSLSGERSKAKIIGLILEHVTTPFGLDMLYEIDTQVQKAGYQLYPRFSYGSREKETEEIEFLSSLGVVGLLIMPCHGSHYSNALLKLIISDFPIVLIDKKMEGIPVSSVRTNNRKAISDLVHYQVLRNCKKIGLITIGDMETTSLIERRQGFYNAILEEGLLTIEECNLPHSIHDFLSNQPEPLYIQLISEYLKTNKNRLDGVICAEFGNLSALVCAANDNGIKLGTDLLVCCIDEDHLAPEGYHFTHVKQDEKQIADKAVQLLLCIIKDGHMIAEDYEIPGLFFENDPVKEK